MFEGIAHPRLAGECGEVDLVDPGAGELKQPKPRAVTILGREARRDQDVDIDGLRRLRRDVDERVARKQGFEPCPLRGGDVPERDPHVSPDCPGG